MSYPRLIGEFSAERDSNNQKFTAHAYEDEPNGRCYMMSDFDVDTDGLGSHHGDKTAQDQTTLVRPDGKFLNADLESFIVLPKGCINGVKGIVLGCQARITYRRIVIPAVVGDEGPWFKSGEGSYKAAGLLEINQDPNNGGLDDPFVLFEWWPGVPAVLDGYTYKLQPHRY